VNCDAIGNSDHSEPAIITYQSRDRVGGRDEVTDERPPRTAHDVSGTDLVARAEQLLAELARIRNAPVAEENTMSPLTEKQRRRINAFGLRNRLRAEDDRPR